MSWLASATKFLARFGGSARRIAACVIESMVPGGPMLREAVSWAIDAASGQHRDDAPPSGDLDRLGEVFDLCDGPLADLCERIGELGDEVRDVRRLVDSALAREPEAREALKQVADLAAGMETLHKQGRKILREVNYGNELAEAMLPLLQENQRVVVRFIDEARAAGLAPKAVVESLSSLREMMEGLLAGQGAIGERIAALEGSLGQKSPALALARAADEALRGDARTAARRLGEASRHSPDDLRLADLSRGVTRAAGDTVSHGGSTSTVRAGEVVDGWTLAGQIGFGGWGSVYRAERDGRLRAMKLLHPELSRDTDCVEAFKREIQSLVALHATGRQPHLVVLDLFGYDTKACCWYLLMEFVDGESLEAKLRGGPLSPAEVVPLLATLAGEGGLATVHDRGLVHRDIKPSNIIVRPDGTPVLIDFGLALGGKHGLSLVQRVTGYTVDYAAPEQLRGQAADTRSDVYSLTATLWKALTGQKPEACDPDDLPDVLRPLREVLRAGLHVNAAKRPANARAWADALRAAQMPQPVKQLPAIRPVTSKGPCEPRPVTTLAGHGREVCAVAFSPDGRTLATASGDWKTRLWNIPEGTLAATLAVQGESALFGSILGLAFSPDGKTLATASRDWSARLWRLPECKQAAKLAQHSEAVSAVAFSPDGSKLATASHDRRVILWSVPEGRQLSTMRGPGRLFAVAFSPDGKFLATGGNGAESTQIWDVAGGHPLATLKAHADLMGLAFRPDGKMLATGGIYGDTKGAIRLWGIPNGQEAGLVLDLKPVYAVAFSPDGQVLAAGCGDEVRLWSVPGLKALGSIPAGCGTVYSVAFDRSGRFFSAGGSGNVARVWDLADDPGDWSYLPPGLTPRADLSLSLAGNGRVYPGDHAWVRLHLANTGKGAFVQLVAETRSPFAALDGLRTYPGLVRPGESVERCLAGLVPTDARPGPLSAKLHFREANGNAPAPVDVTFEILPLPRSDFSVTWRLVNDDSGNSVGNGDGRPKRGETIDVAVRLANSTGEALFGVKVVLAAKTIPAGVAVSIPEQTIDSLPNAGTAEARVTFAIRPNANTGPASFELRVSADDRTFAIIPVETAIA